MADRPNSEQGSPSVASPVAEFRHSVDGHSGAPVAQQDNNNNNTNEIDDLRPLRELGVLSARKIAPKCNPFLCDGMDFFADPNCPSELQKGNAYFFFSTKLGTMMDEEERFVMSHIINLSSFKDETKENNVPFFDPFDDADASKYTIIMTKATYMISGVTVSQLTPQFVSSVEYQKSCQPENSTIDPNVPDDTTIRFSKTVIRFIYNMTVQLKISRIDPRTLPLLSQFDRVKLDGGLLLERTKRQVTKVDGTAKAKSVLLYTSVDGGVLVTNITVAINTSIPTVASSILNNFGATGAREVAETAERTRKYLGKKFAKK